MPGLFSRLKTWIGLEIVQNSDLNGELDNIINNLGPSGMSGWSGSVAQMQIQTSPGAFGTESLATSTNGEIERLRYQLNAIIGGTDNVWYDQPALSLSQVLNLLPNSPPTNRIVSGTTMAGSKQPAHLVPSGGANTITLLASSGTPFIVFINGVQYSFTANATLSGLAQPPGSNNTFSTNDATNLDGTTKTKNIGAYIADFNALADGTSQLLKDYAIIGDTVGTNITSLGGTYQVFKHINGTTEYVLGYVNPGVASGLINLSKCWKGCFIDSTSTQIPPAPISEDDTFTLMNLIWIYVNTGGALSAVYSHPRFGPTQPTSFAAGDMWYDTVNQTWKQTNGSSYSVANVVLIGICVTDGTNCVAARSFDWYAGFSNTSNIVPEFFSTTEYRTKYDSNYANIYGFNRYFEKDSVRWTTGNLVAGLSLSSSNTYYLYLSETGASWIDKHAPLRRPDLGGFYHPAQSWRCFGLFFYNGSANFDSVLLAPLSLLNGEVINDKSLSISKMVTSQTVITDANAGSPLTAPIDGFGVSTVAVGSGGATTLLAVPDTNNKPLTVNINTSGRPVMYGLTADGNQLSNAAQVGAEITATGIVQLVFTIAFFMDTVEIYRSAWQMPTNNTTNEFYTIPVGSFWGINTNVAPGTHAFTVKYAFSDAGVATTITLQNFKLFAFEL